jgi:hypothetical protein
MAADAAAPPPRARKKDSAWFRAVRAAALPALPTGVPPRSKAASAALRDARLALVRAFWPGEQGPGGRDCCHACRFGASRVAWAQCRGRGGGTRNGHGPLTPDWFLQAFPLGARVRCASRGGAAVEGVLRAYDEGSGFFTLALDDGTEVELFLTHAQHKAEVGALRCAALCCVCAVCVCGAGGADARVAAPQLPRLARRRRRRRSSSSSSSSSRCSSSRSRCAAGRATRRRRRRGAPSARGEDTTRSGPGAIHP